MAFWNANGILGKLSEMRVFLSDYNIDVMLLSETHTKPSQDMKVPGYTTYRTDRLTKPGGGTAVLIKTGIKHHEMGNTDVTPTLEYSAILIDDRNLQRLKVIAVYKPPERKLNILDMDKLLEGNMPTVLAGDLNSKHTDWGCRGTNAAGRQINAYINDKTDTVVLAPPDYTHYAHSGLGDILDIAVIKNISNYISCDTVDELSSDHKPVLLTLEGHAPKEGPPPTTVDWSKIEYELSKEKIKVPILQTREAIDLAVEKITTSLKETLEANKRPKRNTDPSLPPQIKRLISEKNKIRRLYHATLYPPYKRELNKMQRKIKSELRTYDNKCLERHITDANESQNKLWRMMREKTSPNGQLPPLSGPTGISFSVEDKLEAFADTLERQFVNNYLNMDIDLAEEVDRTVRRHRKGNRTQADVEEHITPREVKDIVDRMPNKAPGHDGIPTRLLKLLPHEHIMYMTALYNAILRTSYYPTEWKQAVVIMIPKPGKNNKFPQNYRPISLLPILAKILEKIIHDRLTAFITDNQLIPPEQFGFRMGHDTTMQLVRVTEYIRTSFAWRQTAAAIFLDVEKAFDRVWHRGLLYKLIQLQIPDYIINIVRSFLSDRTFQVRIGSDLSTRRNIKAGVPQGSALSPTLYNLYTHDIPSGQDRLLATYADDTALIVRSKSPLLAEKKLQDMVDELAEYFNKWRIKINEGKSITIMFNRDPRFVAAHNITINGINLQRAPEVKYLGVILDQGLKFRRHVEETLCKAKTTSARLYPLTNYRSRLTLGNKIVLYRTMIEPILTYAAPIWNTAASVHKQKLQVLQNKIIRSMVNAYRYTPNRVIYRDLRIRPIIDVLEDRTEKAAEQAATHKNSLVRKATDYDPYAQLRVKKMKTAEDDRVDRPP